MTSSGIAVFNSAEAKAVFVRTAKERPWRHLEVGQATEVNILEAKNHTLKAISTPAALLDPAV